MQSRRESNEAMVKTVLNDVQAVLFIRRERIVSMRVSASPHNFECPLRLFQNAKHILGSHNPKGAQNPL